MGQDVDGLAQVVARWVDDDAANKRPLWVTQTSGSLYSAVVEVGLLMIMMN